MLTIDDVAMRAFRAADDLRRLQGHALEYLGFGPTECSFRVIASDACWRIRAYGEGGARKAPVALIVSAPIKRPYVWDLCPGASAVRHSLRRGVKVYLLEWMPPRIGGPMLGLDEAADAIGEGVASVARDAGGARPFLMGHSIGGTLAAIFATLEPERLKGLVLLGSPLCFGRGVSHFGDALAELPPPTISDTEIVPGALISQLSALASPETFVWSRVVGATLSLMDPKAIETHARIERWALDEVPLPGKLVRQILFWLYREDRFCRGSLPIRSCVIGPTCLRLPTFAVANAQDDVAPPASMSGFLDAAPAAKAHLIVHPGEIGAGLQHLAALVGRRAHAEIWPKILSWVTSIEGRG